MPKLKGHKFVVTTNIWFEGDEQPPSFKAVQDYIEGSLAEEMGTNLVIRGSKIGKYQATAKVRSVDKDE